MVQWMSFGSGRVYDVVEGESALGKDTKEQLKYIDLGNGINGHSLSVWGWLSFNGSEGGDSNIIQISNSEVKNFSDGSYSFSKDLNHPDCPHTQSKIQINPLLIHS